MANQNVTGIRRIYNAFFFSMKGFRAIWVNEAAFRQELLLFLIFTPLGFWLGETKIDQILLVGSLTLILLAELLNSAIEAVVDRVGYDHHELSGRAKDIGSAAVFLTLVWAAFTWYFILIY
jgi:diacylglycerol kinase (ATP)